MNLVERYAIHSAPVDRNGRLVPEQSGFWRYLGLEPPSSPLPLTEVFDELVGREVEILDIVRSGSGEIEVPGIARGDRYFDLAIIPGDEDEEKLPALAVLRDSTQAMLAQQFLLQQRNEIELLKRGLEERQARLDELMETIRTQNHDLESKIRLRTRDLRQSRLSVITKLARVAEFRDKETGGHIYRIGRSCVLVSRMLGLAESDCEAIFHASLLHDVGKVGIPDAILLKPGRLTPEEREVMQTHTLLGAELLGGDDFLLFRQARDIARFHHEKWDGTGYPEARKGPDIPLMARICSVVDVFDALMSTRPYKEAWSGEKAAELIRRESGSSFDPDVVVAFFAVIDDIVTLRQDSCEDAECLPEQY